MKIAILGYGLQGKSSFDYFSKNPENQITICDQKLDKKMPSGVKTKLGNDYMNKLDQFDLIVRSPSIHPQAIVEANDERILEKITTNTNIFFEVCPSKNIIGVTGTKGKGTTSTLIAKMLEADGRRVHLGGNIGTPPLEMLKDNITPDDWIVLELANFQLIDLRYSPPLAVCLMVTSEHLDFHPGIEDYHRSKMQLFRWQNNNDKAIFYAKNKNSQSIASAGQAMQIPYYAPPGAVIENDDVIIDNQSICSTGEIKLLGKHNWQNICAATTAVWQLTQNVEAIRSVATSFSGLEMRLELVRELDGVKYYNDSFGTTPETAQVAIEALKEPKVVILGGSDKGVEFNDLAQTIKNGNVKKAVLIGHTAPKIKSALEKAGFTDTVAGGDKMKDIVEVAREHAKSGDTILLSTGCASFGLFKNYKDRGRQFNDAVKALV